MGDPISLLIWLIVVALVCYIAFWALSQIPLPQPIRTVIIVIIALVLIVFLLRQLGIWL